MPAKVCQPTNHRLVSLLGGTSLQSLTRLRNQARRIRDGSEGFATLREILLEIAGATVWLHVLPSCPEALPSEITTRLSIGLGEVWSCFRLSYLTKPREDKVTMEVHSLLGRKLTQPTLFVFSIFTLFFLDICSSVTYTGTADAPISPIS